MLKFRYQNKRRYFFTLYKHALAEQKRLQNQIFFLNSQINALPEGKLLCTRNGGHFKWYHSNDHKLSYIPKKDKSFAEQLAVKQYLSLLSEDCLHEQRAIDQYLKYHKPDQAETFLAEPSEYQRLLAPYFQTFSQELLEWMNTPYNKNKKYPEHLTHKTISGHLVRSKSEAMIAMILHTNHIPFRYECALEFEGESFTIYPDFTIRHPQTGKIFYWEHFGRMDDPQYVESTLKKLKLYILHGIIPSHQLITTFETKEQPLDVDTIQKTAEHYFLQ